MKTPIPIKFVVATAVLAVAVQAHWYPMDDSPGQPQPWKSGETTVTYSDDKVLRVSGNGAMEDYVVEREDTAPTNNAPWPETIVAVIIEKGVTYVGESAFFNIFSTLRSITVAEDNAHYSSEDGILFNKNKSSLVQYPNGILQDAYTIPSSVTHIEKWAFSRTRMKSITIPNSVTYIGEKAFRGSRLTSITIPGSVKVIGAAAFEFCDSLTSVTIEDGVTTIGESAFYSCKNLTSVAIPKSVTSIESCAFDGRYNAGYVTVMNPRPPKLGPDAGLYEVYVPARSIFAYRAADGWKELDIRPIVTSYEIIALSILSALLLPAVLFVVVKKSRERQRVKTKTHLSSS